jgi:hypothetical protein
MGACFAGVEAFKDCAAGFQSLIIAAAVIFGGIWTLYIFRSLGAKTKADMELFRQGVINIEISAAQIAIPGERGLYITAVATLTNSGNRNVALVFDDAVRPFLVSPIKFDATGHGAPVDATEFDESDTRQGDGVSEANEMTSSGFDLSNSYQGSAILRRGAVQRVPLFTRVNRPGLYLVEFRTRLNEIEHQVDLQDIPGNDDERYWTSSTHVTVQWPVERGGTAPAAV